MTQKKDTPKKFINGDGIGLYSGFYLLMLIIVTPLCVFGFLLAISIIVEPNPPVISGVTLWLDRLVTLLFLLTPYSLVLLFRRKKIGMILMCFIIILEMLQGIYYDLQHGISLISQNDLMNIAFRLLVALLIYFAWRSQAKYMNKYSSVYL